MTANEDLEKIREAVTGRPGPAFDLGTGPSGKGKKKGGPAPLPREPVPIPPPPPPPQERRTGAGGFLGGIAILVIAVIVGNAWFNGELPSQFGLGRPSSSAGSPRFGTSESYDAPVEKKLKISPKRGSIRTTITLTGSGFIRNGQVRLTFHATQMGVARTDGKGRFKVRMRIPSPDFYAHFPGQTFSISTTEWTRDGGYAGNGPRAGFHLT